MAEAKRTAEIIFDRPKDVWKGRGKGRSQHYADIQQGLWPPPIRNGKRSTAHPRHESDAVKAAQLAGANNDEIRALVQHLIAARGDLARELIPARVSNYPKRKGRGA